MPVCMGFPTLLPALECFRSKKLESQMRKETGVDGKVSRDPTLILMDLMRGLTDL